MTLTDRQVEMKSRMVKTRCNRKLSTFDELRAVELREKGWTLQRIADVFHMSRVGVLYILRRAL